MTGKRSAAYQTRTHAKLGFLGAPNNYSVVVRGVLTVEC